MDIPFLERVTMGWVLVGEGGGAKEEDEGIGLGKGGSGKAGGRMGSLGCMWSVSVCEEGSGNAEGMMGSLGSMGSVNGCGKGRDGLCVGCMWAVCGVLDNERG